jgi:acetyl esterase/lipase
MRIAHDGDAGSDFRAAPWRWTIGPMPTNDALHRVADLRLRGAGPAPVRVRWPAGAATPTPLAVYLPGLEVEAGDDELCAELCASVGAVVLCAPWGSCGLERAAGVLEWAADHAHELGADPGRLVLAGSGAGAAACVVLGRRARGRGWPRITHQLVMPRRPAGEELAAHWPALRAALGMEAR